MDAATSGAADGLPGTVDVGHRAAGERGDDGPTHLLRHALDRLGVVCGGDGEAGFDHVDAKRFEAPGQPQLFLEPHGEPRRLLTVTESRIEDNHIG